MGIQQTNVLTLYVTGGLIKIIAPIGSSCIQQGRYQALVHTREYEEIERSSFLLVWTKNSLLEGNDITPGSVVTVARWEKCQVTEQDP